MLKWLRRRHEKLPHVQKGESVFKAGKKKRRTLETVLPNLSMLDDLKAP